MPSRFKKIKRGQLMIPIPDTILWIVVTFLIAFLCILTVSIVYFLTQGKGEPTSAQLASQIFPEKAEMLYSVLSTQVNGERVDDIIAKDGNAEKIDTQDLVKNVPPNSPNGFWDLHKIWTFNTATNEILTFVDMTSSVNKFRIGFLIFSDKKVNAIMDLITLYG